MIDEYHVSSLSEYYEVINCIGEKEKKKGDSIRLWFRGHSKSNYSLIPTLYRGENYKSNSEGTYTEMNLKESLRFQHMKARAFHCVDSEPSYQSEWQEIYQHHFGKTRLMDWSESAKTGLSFSVEPYIDTSDNRELKYKRQHITPCVWVLNPYRLNEMVYDYMSEYLYDDMELVFQRVYDIDVKFKKICMEMKQNKELYFDCKKADIDIKGILSLCAIEDYRKTLGSYIVNAVNSYEFNPFYYLALRMYSDALPVKISDYGKNGGKILPPIALLHPYHSERIRAQRGAFTMFPNYVLEGKANAMLKYRKIDGRDMINQQYISDCLHVIYIHNAKNVAKTLLYGGERRSELYPDLQVYADLIETKKYYC